MYDEETSLEINDEGAVYLHPPGRRKRRVGFVGTKSVEKHLIDEDLALLPLWSYIDHRLEVAGLRSLVTVIGQRSERYHPHGVMMIAFTIDRTWMKKRWGYGDWDVMANEFIARLEAELPLPRAGVVVYHQTLPTHWYVAVPVRDTEEADAFMRAVVSTIEDFPGLKLSMT